MAKFVKKLKHTKEELKNMAEEYLQVSKKIKLLDSTKKMLSDKIKEVSEELGVKDDKGSFYYETDEYVTGKVAKKHISLDEEKAKELLREKGIYDDVVEIETVEKINEDILAEKVTEGIISEEEFESICNIKTSYSVSVTEKKKMPEVEVSNLKAASKK